MDRIAKDILNSLIPKTQYLVGNVGNRGIVISAPHGGGVRPLTIPKRKYGKMGKDTYTRKVVELLVADLNPKPYYIYSDLHRSRLDLNRDLQEGAQGNPKAEEVWNSWNIIIESFLSDCVKKHGKALYIEIHSQSNTPSFHLGYNITAKQYRNLRDTGKMFGRSTLAGLGENQHALLFGAGSFYHSLINMGYSVYNPESDRTYFNGGYGINEHSGEHVGAIQIEIPSSLLKKNNLERLCNDLSTAIENFSGKFLYYRSPV